MLKRMFGRGRGATAIDPVCGMRVDKDNPPGGSFKPSGEKPGITYYFCGDGCRRAFEKDPVSFLEAAKSGGSDSHTGHGESGSELSPTAPISFTATDDPSGEGKFVDVAYVCVCGCTPGARVITDSSEAASEHCCCGRVHFAGDDAQAQIREYMAERAKTDMDADVAPYVYADAEAVSESGKSVAVAYAQPERPRK
jgi:YHS domain-containing protein